MTAGGPWTQVPYAPFPDGSGNWLNAFPADFTHEYVVYDTYDVQQSGNCIYPGNNDIAWCP